jgi:WXXGXW repeat (2 copies)
MIQRLVASLLLSASIAALAPPLASADTRVYVKIRPPIEIVETRGTPPSRRHVWIPGHHSWDGNAYVWVPGHWEVRPRARAVWVRGRWVHSRRGWYWVEGHWRR